MAFGPCTWKRYERRGSQVELDRDVVPARLRVVHDPVERGRPADELVAAVAEREQDDVADDVALEAAGHEVFGAISRVSVEAVHREVGEQPERVRAFDGQVVHVVREVEEDAGLLPGPLLVAPVRELRRHTGIDVRPCLRVAEQLDRASGPRQQVFEARSTHAVLPSRGCRDSPCRRHPATRA
jgi:predicted Zn-dependent protease with MMP-like domain